MDFLKTDVSVGPIDGLNYRLLYDLLPSKVSDNITLPDLKTPDKVTEDTKKLILCGFIYVAYHHPIETDPSFTKVHKHLPSISESFLIHLVGQDDSNDALMISKLFDILQEKLGDWITINFLKHNNRMSKEQIKTLCETIVELAKAEGGDTEEYEIVWKKMPSYYSNLLMQMLHK
ncbi:NS4 protein [Tenuivirus persotritici]|uniref:NS4 protein n=1 Tax=Tenuivirus persotritici TaxID=3052765 RepID=Q7TBL6_9VIRU|nr:NS4 protein [Tenuivirus persotritici]AAP82277.1 NS4 protein [Tenuivirus persotritici]QCF41974.1 nonstructural protein [Tenuivirus persotritici]